MNRKKKFISLWIVIVMLLAFVPQTALAASHTVSDAQTLNLTSGELTQTSDGTLVTTYTVNAGDTVNVAAGATATITGSKSVQISCGAGVTLTLDSVTSNVSETNNACALGFTGSGNTLILEGESALSSGQMKAGVLVQGATQLTIEGTGMLNARGGDWSAGIGAGTGDCGTLLIRGNVTIEARGGRSYGAGIGGAGGFSGGGSGGNITIESGTVTAIGDGINGSAGIGGGSAQDGYGGNGGNITIKGGTVKAVAGYYGAGIGGGGKSNSPNADGSGRGGVINIRGGTVIAVGGKNNISGGGIGCGGLLHINPADPYTELNITGGNVFVSGGTYDFYVDKDAEFNISNDAAVFLRNDHYASSAANITSHTRYLSRAADVDGYLFGIELPGWPSAEAAFIVPKTVSYDLNGVDGTPISDAIIHSTGVVKIPTQDMTGYNDQELDNWNTQADGLGVGYTPGMFTEVEDDITLYAIWGAHVVSGVTHVKLSQTSSELAAGDTLALRATVFPGGADHDVTWKSSDTNIVTVDVNGKVTAKDFGFATITAEVDGITAVCTIAVVKMDVTGVTLSSTSQTLKKGATVLLSATVAPGDPTYPDVTWTSTDTSVATVSASGQVTAVSEGAAAIIADADGVYAVCTILVSSEQGIDDGNDNGDNGNDADNDDSAQASPTPTPTPADSGDKEDVPDTGDDSPQPTPTPDTVVITIVVSDLPEGTTSVKLPNGEIVELGGRDTVEIEVGAEQLSDDGTVELTALDDEGTPLGIYTADNIASPDTGSAGGGIWSVLMWVLIGIAGAGGIALAAYLILSKRQGA